MTKRTIGLAAVLALWTSGAHAVWVRNAEGDCVREWTSDSLARGPTAMLNAPLVPFRSAVGGVLLAGTDRTPNPGLPRRILLPPLLAVVGGGMGLLESGIWLGTGLFDTLTGGYLEAAPDEATHLAAGPLAPAFSEGRPTPPESRCGH